MPTIGRRNPGPVPQISWPPREEEIDHLNKWARKITESLFGHPAKHASTHMQEVGDGDSLANTGTPSEITFDTEGDPGEPTGGFAAWDHEHPASEELAALEGLSGVSTETIKGNEVAYVYSPEENQLLSEILLELLKLEEP